MIWLDKKKLEQILADKDITDTCTITIHSYGYQFIEEFPEKKFAKENLTPTPKPSKGEPLKKTED